MDDPPPPPPPDRGLEERLHKRRRNLRKRLDRIEKVEQAVSTGSILTKEKAQMISCKVSVKAIIDELNFLLPEAADTFPSDSEVALAEKTKKKKEKKKQRKVDVSARSYAGAITSDDGILQRFQVFLQDFTREGEVIKFFLGEFKSMIERLSPFLNICYSDLVAHDRDLGMLICGSYATLSSKLTVVAEDFLDNMMENDVPDEMRNLILRIEGMPQSHVNLSQFLRRPMLKPYVHDHRPFKEEEEILYSPTPDGGSMFQGILRDLIENHKKGLSWKGNINVKDIEVFNDTIFRITKTLEYKFDPSADISEEIGLALKMDFSGVCGALMPKFSTNGAYSPIFQNYRLMLCIAVGIFCDPFLLENFRTLALHNPAIKPPMESTS